MSYAHTEAEEEINTLFDPEEFWYLDQARMIQAVSIVMLWEQTLTFFSS